MYNLNDVKTFCDDAFLAVGEKGINVSGMPRSQLPAAIRAIELNDYTNINQSLSNILGETVTDVSTGLTKLAAIKEAERQAIVAKGTLVTTADQYDLYAQKIRAIRSYSDLTYSGIMPSFILDPEPTGSTIVYMRPGATGDGTSWDNATGDFIAAHASLSGSKNVIYMEEGSYPVTGLISLKINIKIYGGFKANDHSWGARNSFTNRTILDAQLTELKIVGSGINDRIVDGLTIINSRVSSGQGAFYNVCYSKNLIVQDCVNIRGAFYSCNYCQNLIAINCTATADGGGFFSILSSQKLLAINCSASNGGGLNSLTNCSGILALNCKASSQGGGLYGASNCINAKVINCSGTSNGSGTFADINCKNFLIANCSGASACYITSGTSIQNYTIINCSTPYAFVIPGGTTLAGANKCVNIVCLNNKDTSGTLVGFRFNTANYYYKLYNCRADTAINFAANAATNADIQNFYLIQNNNSETKFANTGTYPIVGNLPYDNNVINDKYLAGDYGDFKIPQDSVLAGAGYWEDGFSFGWDIDGKPRDAAHCSIGAYEPNWA